MSGKLIVIEGTDGSGKATQAKLLKERLECEGYPVYPISFPQYESDSSGPVRLYLAGALGPPDDVGPYRASQLYAVDRTFAVSRIREALGRGDIVLSDRYVDSNAGHQGGKIADAKARAEFLQWLYRTEYGDLEIPKPDLVVILHMPTDITLRLMRERAKQDGRTLDGHECNHEHLRAAEESYLWLARQYPNEHIVVACFEGGEPLSEELIAQRIWAIVREELNGSLVHGRRKG